MFTVRLGTSMPENSTFQSILPERASSVLTVTGSFVFGSQARRPAERAAAPNSASTRMSLLSTLQLPAASFRWILTEAFMPIMSPASP